MLRRRITRRRMNNQPSKKYLKMEKYKARVEEMCTKSVHSLCANERAFRAEYRSILRKIDGLKLQQDSAELIASRPLLEDQKRLEDKLSEFIPKKVLRLIKKSFKNASFHDKDYPLYVRDLIDLMYQNYRRLQWPKLKFTRQIEELESIVELLDETLETIASSRYLYSTEVTRRSIRVINLPENVDKEDLAYIFGYRQMLNSRLEEPIKKLILIERGKEAIIKYFDSLDAKTAVEKMNGYQMGKNVLKVEFAKKE